MRYLMAVILASALSLPVPATAEWYFLTADRVDVSQQTVFYNQGDHIVLSGGQHYVLDHGWKYLGLYVAPVSPPLPPTTVQVGDSTPVRQVPEPDVLILLGAGLVVLAVAGRKKV